MAAAVEDINEVIGLSMATKLEMRKGPRNPRREACTIGKVPDKIRKAGPEAYEPQIVSIGPIHHGNLKLLPMEDTKWQFLHSLIGRHESNSLKNYISKVSDPSFVQQIAECYSEEVIGYHGRNNFVEILVLDGCFIIEFLVKFFLREPRGEIDNFELAKNDLLLIENQIPFSVLEVLYNSSFVPRLHDNNLPFSIRYLAEYIMSFDGYDRPAPAPQENHLYRGFYYSPPQLFQENHQSLYPLYRFYRSPPQVPPVIHHYLHLRHYSLRPTPIDELRSSLVKEKLFQKILRMIQKYFFVLLSSTRTPTSYDGFKVPRTTRSATELNKAGIIFKPKRARSILDVTFRVNDGVMEIPVLTFKATSMPQFRNLLALEQYIPDIGSHVTSFVLFMKSLINKPADVEILVERGVLESKLGGEEVVDFFNTIGEAAYLDYDQDCLGVLYKDVKCYCDKPRNRLRAMMINVYFTNPWTIMVLMQAVIALLLSIVQSIFTIVAYYKPPRSKLCHG